MKSWNKMANVKIALDGENEEAFIVELFARQNKRTLSKNKSKGTLPRFYIKNTRPIEKTKVIFLNECKY